MTALAACSCLKKSWESTSATATWTQHGGALIGPYKAKISEYMC